jgi:hypothetical protein
MTTTAQSELDQQTARDVALLATLSDEIRDRTDQANEIKTRLRALGTGVWRHGDVDVLDVAEPGLQFDPKLAATVIPPALHAVCSQTALHGPTAKKVLPAELYARCCTPKAAAVKTL